MTVTGSGDRYWARVYSEDLVDGGHATDVPAGGPEPTISGADSAGLHGLLPDALSAPEQFATGVQGGQVSATPSARGAPPRYSLSAVPLGSVLLRPLPLSRPAAAGMAARFRFPAPAGAGGVALPGVGRAAGTLLGHRDDDAAADARMAAVQAQVTRQVFHWMTAVEQLAERTTTVGTAGWEELERYLGVALRASLDDAIARVRAQALTVAAELAAVRTVLELDQSRRSLLRLRRQYEQAETLVTFYTHAVACRANPAAASLLRACDVIAVSAMRPFLTAAGKPTPPALTYPEKGLGAAILRAGLRLWDGGTLSAVSSIKVVWHNLMLPTAITHEAGHQVAFTLGWNDELAAALHTADATVGPDFARWASEIAADAVAFATTGYGSVSALHDVVAGEAAHVYSGVPGGVHPPAWLRVLLGTAMTKAVYGAGPWDDLASAWQASYPLSKAPRADQPLLAKSLPVLPRLAETILAQRYAALGGRRIVDIVDPAAVRPDTLLAWERAAGSALWTSPDYLSREPLRLLALGSYRVATEPTRSPELLQHMRAWLTRLGDLSR
jgi:hypothetical protein